MTNDLGLQCVKISNSLELIEKRISEIDLLIQSQSKIDEIVQEITNLSFNFQKMKENCENQATNLSSNFQKMKKNCENQARISVNSLSSFSKNVNDEVKRVKEISTKDMEAEFTDSQKQLLLSR